MSGSVEIRCTDPLHVPFVWALVRDQFKRVLDEYPSDTTIEATERDLLKGLQLLWVAWRGLESVGAATTAIYATPARKLCVVLLGFGDGRNLVRRFFPIVETYARAEGCSNLRLSGREGWERALREFGFRQPWIVLDKELN